MLRKALAYVLGLFGKAPARTVEDILDLVGDDGTFWTGRRGVKKHLKGGELKFDPKAKRLVTIWIPEEHRLDNDKDNGYRCIPVEGIHEIKAKGRRWTVENGIATEVTE